jgi:hypothetical protein
MRANYKDVSFAIAVLLGFASASTYTANSYWYSSSLRDDGYNTNTSYDYSYRASYSYDRTNSDVHKWNYSTSSWQQCPNTYCGETSTSVPPNESYTASSYWYSPSLSSDGYNTNTSYDYSYRASYSYDRTNSDVHKWNYSYSSWQQCPNTYCGATSTTVPPIEPSGNNKTVSYWYSPSLY